MRSSPGGYTLLDILMAIGVTTIVATMAVPAVSGILGGYELSAAAQELAAEMGAARTLAVSRGSSYTVTFNLSEKSYQVVDISDSSNPTRVARSLSGKVSFLAVPAQAIQFAPRGLARGGTVVLSDGADALAVVVDASGKANVTDVQTGEVLSEY